MKQIASDKYTIAWFKLADCVARGEKERALGVFRLLSHSFDDSALARQLHGDLLLSFQDESAINQYQEAARLYEDDHRILEAAAVYEHLVSLKPEIIEYHEKLIQLYQMLSIASKVQHYVDDLLEYLLNNEEWQKAIEIVKEYDISGDSEFAAHLHEKLVFSLLLSQGIMPDVLLFHVKRVIESWQQAQNERALTEFMEKLKAADEKLYAQVCHLN